MTTFSLRFSPLLIAFCLLPCLFAGRAGAQTTIASQNYDSVTAPSATFTGWNMQYMATTTTQAVSAPNSITPNVVGAFGHAVYGSMDGNGGNVTVSSTFSVNSIAAAAYGILVSRDSAVPAASSIGPNNYQATVTFGPSPTFSMSKSVSSTATAIGSTIVPVSGFLANVQYRAFLTTLGGTQSASLEALTGTNANQWLNASGVWQSTQVACITGTDTSVTGQGYAGIALYTAAVFADDTLIQTAGASAMTGATATASSTASSVSLSVSPLGGTGPFSTTWYRSLLSGFSPPGVGTVVGTTSPLADVPPDNQVYYYRCIVTDSEATPITQTSNQVASALQLPPLNVGFIGDSITFGYSGGSQIGTPATSAFGLYLQSAFGPRVVTANNRGISGTTTLDWQSGSANYNNAVASFGSPSVTPYVEIMLGTNDANVNPTTGNVSASTYKTRLGNITSALTTAGYKVILNAPIYLQPNIFGPGYWTESSLALMQSYTPQIDSLANGATILKGDRVGFAYFATHQSEIADGTHPTQQGYYSLGYIWAKAYASATGLSPAGTKRRIQ